MHIPIGLTPSFLSFDPPKLDSCIHEYLCLLKKVSMEKTKRMHQISLILKIYKV
jgi:hypothetical protein